MGECSVKRRFGGLALLGPYLRPYRGKVALAANEAELIEFVKSRKGSLVAPKSVEFIAGIPVTNLGKVDKKALRARFPDPFHWAPFLFVGAPE